MALKTRHWDRLGNGGVTLTELGFGAAPLGNLYRAISDEDADAILAQAWEGGVRYYDTAPLYGFGLSETRLNRFLRGKPRDEYVLSSKVGRLLQACPPQEADGEGKWSEVPSRKEVYIIPMMGSCDRLSSRWSGWAFRASTCCSPMIWTFRTMARARFWMPS